MEKNDSLQCESCESLDADVTYWAYYDELGFESDNAGYYCADCGSKPYRAQFYFLGIITVLIIILGFIT